MNCDIPQTNKKRKRITQSMKSAIQHKNDVIMSEKITLNLSISLHFALVSQNCQWKYPGGHWNDSNSSISITGGFNLLNEKFFWMNGIPSFIYNQVKQKTLLMHGNKDIGQFSLHYDA